MSTLQTLGDLATNPVILASGLVAATSIVVATVRPDGLTKPGTTALAPGVALLSFAVAFFASDVATARYLSADALAEVNPIATVAILVAAVSFSIPFRASAPLTSRRDASFLLAGAAIGIYLCVPETDLLRLVLLPIGIPAVAALVGWIEPYGQLPAVTLGAGLGWVALIDGSSRSSAIVGAFGCLLVVAALPTLQRRSGHSRWSHLVVATLAMIGCSRFAGLQDSGGAAIASLGLVTTASAVALLALSRSGSVVTRGEAG